MFTWMLFVMWQKGHDLGHKNHLSSL